MHKAVADLLTIQNDMRNGAYPLDIPASTQLLEGLRDRILDLHTQEEEAAQMLANAV
jgi:hypothetical protein